MTLIIAAIVVLSNLPSVLRCDGPTMRRFMMSFAAEMAVHTTRFTIIGLVRGRKEAFWAQP